MSDLFDQFDEAVEEPADKRPAPLAERLRPRSLADVIGQDHIRRLTKVLSGVTVTGVTTLPLG